MYCGVSVWLSPLQTELHPRYVTAAAKHRIALAKIVWEVCNSIRNLTHAHTHIHTHTSQMQRPSLPGCAYLF